MNIEIANRLVALRKDNGFSQEGLAEKLGISRQAVSKWERAESSPDTDNLIALAKLYNVSLDALLNSSEESIEDERFARIQTGQTYHNEDPQDLEGPRHFLQSFPYPVLITILYLILGFCGWWHPGWILFLTIPIYNRIARYYDWWNDR